MSLADFASAPVSGGSYRPPGGGGGRGMDVDTFSLPTVRGGRIGEPGNACQYKMCCCVIGLGGRDKKQ